MLLSPSTINSLADFKDGLVTASTEELGRMSMVRLPRLQLLRRPPELFI